MFTFQIGMALVSALFYIVGILMSVSLWEIWTSEGEIPWAVEVPLALISIMMIGGTVFMVLFVGSMHP